MYELVKEPLLETFVTWLAFLFTGERGATSYGAAQLWDVWRLRHGRHDAGR